MLQKFSSLRDSRRQLELVVLLFWASQYSYVSYMTVHLESLGIAEHMIGLIAGAYGFMQLAVRIPIGIHADTHGSQIWLTRIGVLLSLLAALGMAVFSSPVLLLLSRSFSGLAAAMWVVMVASYMGLYPPSESVRASARINAMNNGGKLISFLVGSLLAAYLGFRATALAGVVFGLGSLAFAFTLRDLRVKTAPLRFQDFLALLKRPSFWVICLLAALHQFLIHATVFSFTSTVAKENGAGTFALGALTVIFTSIQIVLARFLRRSPPSAPARRRLIVGSFLLFGVYVLILGNCRSLPLIFVGQVIAGCANVPLMTLIMAEVMKGIPETEKTTAMSIYQSVYAVGMMLGPVLMGFLKEHCGLSFSSVVFAAICVFSALVARLGIRAADC